MHRSLYFQVIVAIIAGVALGHFAPEAAVQMKPLGDGFIKLIRMLIPPVIFCTIVTGIAGMRSMKNAGRVGLKALIYFEALTTLALVIGMAVMNLLRPGEGIHASAASIDARAIANYTSQARQEEGVVNFLLHIIPDTLTSPFVSGDMLQILLVSILFSAGLISLGDRGYSVLQLINQISAVLFRVIGIVVRLAPVGAFGAMAFTIGQYGVGALGPLAQLMGIFYLTCVLFVAVVLGAMMRFAGLRLWPLLRYLREELLIVLGTSSSEPALPRLMQKMEALGCSKPVVGMVVPTGYSFNLDGTSIYLTMAALFVAQAMDIPMGFGEQLLLLGMLLLTSKGAAGVTGSGFVVLAATLSTVGHIPVEGLALILGVDRFMSEARAITNFIGNAVATLVVAKWEGALDSAVAREVLGVERGEGRG